MSRNRWSTPSAFEMNASLRGPGSIPARSSGARTVQELDRTTRALRSRASRTRSKWRDGSPWFVSRTSAWRNPQAWQRIVVWRASPKYGMSRAIDRIWRPGAAQTGHGASRTTSRMGEGPDDSIDIGGQDPAPPIKPRTRGGSLLERLSTTPPRIQPKDYQF